MPVHNGLRPDDGECVAGVWKEPTDPPQDQLLCGNEWRSDRLGPAQQDDLLPKHKDFCLQRCSRSKQIGEETKCQPDDSQHPAQLRPILCAALPDLIYDRDRGVQPRIHPALKARTGDRAMMSITTKLGLSQLAAETPVHPFDNWFDPIEAGLRDQVCEFLHPFKSYQPRDGTPSCTGVSIPRVSLSCGLR
jgi:hypothetical protein